MVLHVAPILHLLHHRQASHHRNFRLLLPVLAVESSAPQKKLSKAWQAAAKTCFPSAFTMEVFNRQLHLHPCLTPSTSAVRRQRTSLTAATILMIQASLLHMLGVILVATSMALGDARRRLTVLSRLMAAVAAAMNMSATREAPHQPAPPHPDPRLIIQGLARMPPNRDTLMRQWLSEEMTGIAQRKIGGQVSAHRRRRRNSCA
jgi:hypothetical protein